MFTDVALSLMNCPETMVFDVASSTCIKDDTLLYDQYPPNCVKAVNGAFFPSYTDCSHFWRCNFQRAVLFTCGKGEYWSQHDLTCVYPKDASCKIGRDMVKEMKLSEIFSDAINQFN